MFNSQQMILAAFCFNHNATGTNVNNLFDRLWKEPILISIH
jgi:hypothetical protein